MAAAAAELDMQRSVGIFISLLYAEATPQEALEGDGGSVPLLAQQPQQPQPAKSTSSSSDDITLLDDFIVLQANDEGKFPLEEKLSTGLAAAIVGELVLRGLVELKKTKDKSSVFSPYSEYGIVLIPASEKPTGSDILDEALQLMHKKPSEVGAVWWMRALTNYHLHKGVKHLATRSYAHAKEQGLLEEKDHTTVGVFHSKKFHAPIAGTKGAAYREELRTVFRDFAIKQERPQALRRFALVALLYGMFKSSFPAKPAKISNLLAKDEVKDAMTNMDNMFQHKSE